MNFKNFLYLNEESMFSIGDMDKTKHNTSYYYPIQVINDLLDNKPVYYIQKKGGEKKRFEEKDINKEKLRKFLQELKDGDFEKEVEKRRETDPKIKGKSKTEIPDNKVRQKVLVSKFNDCINIAGSASTNKFSWICKQPYSEGYKAQDGNSDSIINQETKDIGTELLVILQLDRMIEKGSGDIDEKIPVNYRHSKRVVVSNESYFKMAKAIAESTDPKFAKWRYSAFSNAKGIYKYFKGSGNKDLKEYKMHFRDSVMEGIRKKGSALASEKGGKITEDRWCPGDFYFVKNGVRIPTDINDLTLFNQWVSENTLPISLKQDSTATIGALTLSKMEKEGETDSDALINFGSDWKFAIKELKKGIDKAQNSFLKNITVFTENAGNLVWRLIKYNEYCVENNLAVTEKGAIEFIRDEKDGEKYAQLFRTKIQNSGFCSTMGNLGRFLTQKLRDFPTKRAFTSELATEYYRCISSTTNNPTYYLAVGGKPNFKNPEKSIPARIKVSYGNSFDFNLKRFLVQMDGSARPKFELEVIDENSGKKFGVELVIRNRDGKRKVPDMQAYHVYK